MPFIVIFTIALVVGAGSAAHAQSWQPPSDAQRCPSKWGAGDQRGCGQSHEAGNGAAGRAAHSHRAGVRAGARAGGIDADCHRRGVSRCTPSARRWLPESNRRGSNEELVVAEIGQVGTQFDGFSHQTIGDSMYNCFKLDEIATRAGFRSSGSRTSAP